MLIDKRLYELYYKHKWLNAFLNSTLYTLFLELVARTGLGDGLMDLTVYDVENTLIVDLSGITFQFGKFNNREIGSIYFECGFNSVINIRNQHPNPIPDRKVLDDIVFDAIGSTEDEPKEVYWSVCEPVQRRLEKARSV